MQSRKPGLDGLVSIFPRLCRSGVPLRGVPSGWNAGGGGESTVGQARHGG